MNLANETIGTIRGRRSIRNYSERDVPEELIKTLIDTGIHAP